MFQYFNNLIMKVKNVIKFIILVAIFYALLAFNVFQIGEKLSPKAKDYTQIPQSIIENDREEETWVDINENITGHFATTPAMDKASLCNNTNICDKIAFDGVFSDNEKYAYIRILGKIFQFIDKYGTQDQDIRSTIDTIQISKKNGQRRGYATRDTIVLNLWSVKSKTEFGELSSHEMGHITDLGYIQGMANKKDKLYTEFGKTVFAIDDISITYYKLSWDQENIRKAEAKKKDFCSGYGMTDPFEDFAECFNLYTNHNSMFRQIAQNNDILKEKYNFIASLFDGGYLSERSQDLELLQKDITRRPRDTTKLTNN